MVKIIHYKIFFCQLKVGQFNGKLNFTQFRLWNFYSMINDSIVMVDFVFELALGEV